MRRIGGVEMRDRAGCWFAAVIAVALASAAYAQSVQVYKAQHRTVEELAPLVEAALHGEGRVVADARTNALVLSGSPRAVQGALEMLAVLDVRARTVRLRYESRSAGELTSAGVSVQWRAGTGGFSIGDVRWPRGAAAIAVGAEGSATQRTSTLRGELRILDGQSGRISSGTARPVTTRRSRFYASAESGFDASPRVLRDGRVELALRPFDQALRADGAIDRTSAATRVVLEPGATVALGGIAREEDAQGRALTGAGSSHAANESVLLVTVDVE
jgi:type II secretory pathway component GspD/PulD (secretin)